MIGRPSVSVRAGVARAGQRKQTRHSGEHCNKCPYNSGRATESDGSSRDSTITMTNGNVTVEYDLSKGKAAFCSGDVKKIPDFFTEVIVGDQLFTSMDFASRPYTQNGSEYVLTSADNDGLRS